jgi:hypothetical protein
MSEVAPLIDPVADLLESCVGLLDEFVDALFPFNEEGTSRCCEFCSVHDLEDHQPDCLIGRAIGLIVNHQLLNTPPEESALPSDEELHENSGYSKDYVDWSTWRQLISPQEGL